MRKSKIKIKPATMDYAKEFYGNQHTKSFKGYVGLLEGKVVGICGVAYEDKTMMLFSSIKDELRPFKRDIVMGLLKLKNLISRAKYPIVAVASKDENLSERILDRLGFMPSGYLNHDGSKIYWRIP